MSATGEPWHVLGETDWAEALQLQESLRKQVQAGDASAEQVLFTWHRPVVTVGRHADLRHLRVSPEALAARGIALEQARRGGDVTVHGPGQLVVYPVVRLRRGVAAHVRGLGECVASVLQELGVDGARCSRDPLGVFVGPRKIAAIGVHVARGVAIHGLALNVTAAIMPLFELVVPCGLADTPVTYLAAEQTTTRTSTLIELAERIGPALARVLGLPSTHGSIGWSSGARSHVPACMSDIANEQSKGSTAPAEPSSDKPPGQRRVVVLYNTDYDAPPLPGSPRKKRVLGRDASDVAASAFDVRDAVGAYGFAAEIMGVEGHDLPDCIQKLRKDPPDLIFNLTESLAQDSNNEIVVPAVLDMLGIPFTGSGAMALGLCLHKPRAKDILRSRGVPTPASCTLEQSKDAAGVDLPFPLFCKLAREDASVGIKDENVIHDKRGLVRRVRELIEEFQQPVLVERYVEGREIYVTLLGHGDRVQSLPFHEIDFSKLAPGKPRIVGYAAKWDEQSPEYLGTPSVQIKQLPARLKTLIERTAIAAFRALDLRDYGRVDFRISEDGVPYVIDVNPNCDISPGAGVSRAAAAAGLSYPQLIGRICEIALERTSHAHSKARAA